MSDKSPLEKIESETRLLEKIMLFVPGFKGYKQKEMRREADKLIRDHFGRILEKNRNYLREIYGTLVTNHFDEAAGGLERVVTRLDRIVAKIEHASYGYSGFFDAVKISEDDLDRMLGFDVKLLNEFRSMGDLVEAFKLEVDDRKFEKVLAHGNELSKILDRLEETFEHRVDTIRRLEAR